MGESLADELRRRNEAGVRRRENARDAVMTGFLALIGASVAWGMWRLDDRSERLFAIVAQGRAAAGSCP